MIMKKVIEEIKGTLKKKPLNAEMAHNLARFGQAYDVKSLTDKLINDIEKLIESKASSGCFTAIYDLDRNLEQINQEVLNTFKNRGFNCVILNSQVNENIKNTLEENINYNSTIFPSLQIRSKS